MYLKDKFLLIFKHNYFYFFLFLLSNLFSYSLSNLFYLTTRSPDYERYSKYFQYFNGDIEAINLEQGLLYFFISHFFISVFLNKKFVLPENEYFFNFDNFDHIVSIAIQTSNHIIFFIGLLGLYFLFKEYGYNTKNILIVISFLNIVPDSIKLKLTLKPEILGFAIFVWILFFVEKYKLNNEKKYAFSAILLLAIISTLKASIFVMVVISIFFLYFEVVKNLSFKDLIVYLLFFLVVFIPIYAENYSANQRSILDRNDLLTEYNQSNYDNKAELSFIYSFNIKNYFDNPQRDTLSYSAFGITSNEIFGDYFNLYWNLDYSLFKQDVKKFIQSSDNTYLDSTNRILYIDYSRNINFNYLKLYLGFLLSTFFLLYLVLSFIFSKIPNRRINLLPFIGIIVLLLSAFGIPENNFDPTIGDTLKPFYYSFLSIISMGYVLLENLTKRRKLTLILILLLIILFLFIYGFPKENNSKLDYDLTEHSKKTVFCELNNLYLHISLIEKDGLSCPTRAELKCLDLNYIKEISPTMFYKDNSTMKVANLNDCKTAVELGYTYQNNYFKVKNIPIINLSILLIFIFIYVYKLLFKVNR